MATVTQAREAGADRAAAATLPFRATLLWGASGAALTAAVWLPLGFDLLLPVTFAMLLHAVRRVRPGRDAVRLGVVLGVVEYFVGAYFILAIVRYSIFGVLLFALVVAYRVPYAILETWGAVFLHRRAGLPRAAGYALLWIVSEWLRTLGDTSWPADLYGHSMALPAWLSVVRWGGPMLFTAVAFAAAWALELAWCAAARGAWRPAGVRLAVAVAIWLVPPAVDRLAMPPASPAAGPTLSVAVVQPAVALEVKVDRQAWDATWEKLDRLTMEAVRGGGVDLVVWPETARPGPLFWDERVPFGDGNVAAIARRAGVPILYGCEIARVRGRTPVALYNAAAIVYPDDRPALWYAKQRLLPLVEGVPFGRWFGWDPASRAGRPPTLLTMVGNFTPGPGPVVFPVGPARIAPLICYESLYPNLARAARRAGANVLAVLTNDGWWGHTAFPYVHAGVTTARAIENDVPVIRAANNGVSGGTAASGERGERTALDEVRTIRFAVAAGTTRPTPYDAVGDWPAWLAGLILAGAAGRAAVRAARPDPAPGGEARRGGGG